MNRRIAVGVAAALLLVLSSACSSDDGGTEQSASTQPADTSPDSTVSTTTTQPVETGGIDVPKIPGTYPAAVPSLGFGVAIPDGWQATLLSDDALSRLEGANLAEPFFLDSARQVAATGAVFYAAGIDDQSRVAELKIDVQEGADTDIAALRQLADQVAANEALGDTQVVDLENGRIRVDYRVTLTSADDGEPIEAYGSQIFVPDGSRLWAIIVTAEDQDTQDALLRIFQAGFVVA